MQAGRKIFIGGNWKSNNTLKQSTELVQKIYNTIALDTTKVGKDFVRILAVGKI